MNGSAALHNAGLIGSVRQILKLGVGGEHLEEGVDVAGVKGRVPPPHDLEVLLGHRRPSIATSRNASLDALPLKTTSGSQFSGGCLPGSSRRAVHGPCWGCRPRRNTRSA